MQWNCLRSHLIVIWFSCLPLTSFATQPSPTPLKYFAQLPDVNGLSLSPDGTNLASQIRIDVDGTNGTAVQISNIKSGEANILLFSDNTQYFIDSVYWKDNRTLFVTTWYPSNRNTWLGMSQYRSKTRENRLLIIDTHTGAVSSPYSSSYLRKFKILPTDLSYVLDTLPSDPDHILFSSASIQRQYPWYPLVHKLNIKTQVKRVIQRPEQHVYDWMTDQQQRVRVGFWGDEEKKATLIKNVETGKWDRFWPYEDFSADQVIAKGFDKDPNILYINAYHNDLMAVFRVDLRDKNLTRELVYADEHYDVYGWLVYSNLTGEVIGIGGATNGSTRFFDAEYRALQNGIDKALPDTRNFIYSVTDDGSRYLVFSTGPTESGTYYLGSRNPTSLEPLAYRYKQLPPDILASVERIEYKARDGLTIEGFLTTPSDRPKKDLATIIFPHGGPVSRDSKAFDYWAQFFTSRGYAVLQMNFRGSTGQGLEFRKSGLKKWGKEMQDDIEDGALALIERGITDPNKICIAGASYGGYAALMGVTKTPDRYKCAISVNGVSNVKELVIDNRAFWTTYNIIEEMIGDDLAELKAISPSYHADKIKVPVLLIHGELDRQVPIKHSYQMRDALEKAGKDVTFIEQPKEDHYLANEANRIAAFTAMDAFLAKHLPVNATPVVNAP